MAQKLTPDIVCWMDAAASKPRLTNQEMLELAKLRDNQEPDSHAYKKIINKMVEHNLRLVVRVVYKHMKSRGSKGWGSADTSDCLQMGTIGLIKACERYDVTRGYQFSTYATHWIRSLSSRYYYSVLSQWRIPDQVYSDIWAFKKHGYVKCKNAIVSQSTTIGKLERVYQLLNPLYLDASINSANGKIENNPTGQVGLINIADSVPSSAEHIAEPEQFTFEIEDLISAAGINGICVEILRDIYVKEMGLDAISKSRNIPIGHVRSLKSQALKKLKSQYTLYNMV